MNHKIKIIFIHVGLFFCLLNSTLQSQCPGGLSCEDAEFFCSLDEMNGFVCQTLPYSVPTNICAPPCSKLAYSPPDIGYPYVYWWSFTSTGGNSTISISYSVCADTDNDNDDDGISWGLYEKCTCIKEIFCSERGHPTPSTSTFKGYLEPCKIYYLWVGGFEWDVCDFTISTSGGGIPKLDPLGFINNKPSKIIEPVCQGYCGFDLFVSNVGCVPSYYTWTLDGEELAQHENLINLDFPEAGDFIICVSANIGHYKSDIICAKEGPICATIKVRPNPDRIGDPRVLCYETINSGNYQWHTQKINGPGVYRETFVDVNCCKYDSVVEFKESAKFDPKEIFYISCDNKPFVDVKGNKFTTCQDHQLITLPFSTNPYKCDSTYLLTALFPKVEVNWTAKCSGSRVELNPNYKFIPCGFEQYHNKYKWFKKDDTLQQSISADDRILVDTINIDYCIEVETTIILQKDSSICVHVLCDSFNESDFKLINSPIKINFCDSIDFDGNVYFETTQISKQFKSQFGCDSLSNIELKLIKSNEKKYIYRGCDSMLVNGNVYYNSVNLIDSFLNIGGCDSIVTTEIAIAKGSKAFLFFEECDSLELNGIKYFNSGQFIQQFSNIDGCDSLLILDIKINKSNITDTFLTACDKVYFNGQFITTSGLYKYRLKNSTGCDSLILAHINILNSNEYIIELKCCDSILINGISYSNTGIYFQKLISTSGCDSIVRIELDVNKSNSLQNKVIACDSITINGFYYNKSGRYIQELKDRNGCDSILYIDLTINKNRIHNSQYSACDSIVINGYKYFNSGIFPQHFISSNGCDSLLQVEVTIKKTKSTSLNLKSCDSASVNGIKYFQSGSFIQKLSTWEGCDSLIKLDLDISKSKVIGLNFAGCDSIILNNTTYRKSGQYIQNLKTVDGCDSVLIADVSVATSSNNYLSVENCDSINLNGNTYNQSGTYLQKLSNKSGCDSNIYITVKILRDELGVLFAGNDTAICEGDTLTLQASFTSKGNFAWRPSIGVVNQPNKLTSKYFSNTLGKDKVYLEAKGLCRSWIDSLYITINPSDQINIVGDTMSDPCNILNFKATGGTNYYWTPSNLVICLNPTCSEVKIISQENVKFKVSSDKTCSIPAYFDFKKYDSEIYLPNAFSPNDDNINDLFTPIFNCFQIDFYILTIFDRWGNMIFQSNDKELGWNGISRGMKLDPGVYPYLVQYRIGNSENRVKAGNVTLIK